MSSLESYEIDGIVIHPKQARTRVGRRGRTGYSMANADPTVTLSCMTADDADFTKYVL
jgi:hypothetical protein